MPRLSQLNRTRAIGRLLAKEHTVWHKQLHSYERQCQTPHSTCLHLTWRSGSWSDKLASILTWLQPYQAHLVLSQEKCVQQYDRSEKPPAGGMDQSTAANGEKADLQYVTSLSTMCANPRWLHTSLVLILVMLKYCTDFKLLTACHKECNGWRCAQQLW